MFSKLVTLALLTAAGATAPTSAPTAVPTSVPTSAPSAAPSAAPTSVPDEDEKYSINITNGTNATNATNATTTTQDVSASTTSKALVKTVFTAQLVLQSPDDFNLDEYRAALALISGADINNIEVVSVSFAAQAQYKFAEAVTKADVDAAVAKTLGTPQEKVNAKISSSSARRLRADKESRRLSETIVDVTVDVSGEGLAVAKANAATALNGLKDTAALVSELGVSGLELVSSGVLVTVETEMLSSASAAALALDSSSALGKQLGAEVIITETSAATTTTSTIFSTDAEERSAAAPKEALVTPLVLLAVACSNLFL